jgi:hypothetical protein
MELILLYTTTLIVTFNLLQLYWGLCTGLQLRIKKHEVQLKISNLITVYNV